MAERHGGEDMEEETTNKPAPLHVSGKLTGGPDTSGLACTARLGPKPLKPPWHRRFVEQNLSLAKLLKLKAIAQECGKQAVWEIGKWWLGRKRQSANPAEV